MRKLIALAVAVLLASFVAVTVSAEEGSELEISGNVTNVTGWQRTSGGRGVLPLAGGILNDGLAAQPGATTDVFGFYLDQVEIDLAKSYGENIRIRADLDFTPHRVDALVHLEQAYVTANIPAGNGLELLVGRFNSGIGLEPVDRNELKTISFNTVHRTLLPHNLTGARLGYDFSEATRLEFYIVNNLQDAIPAATSDLPSGGFNLRYAWGDEGNKSWIKFAGALGPEQATKKHYSFLGDLAADVAVSDAFRVGVEGVYRQDNAAAGAVDNAQFIGGTLGGTYAFSDVWDGTLRYGFLWDLDASDVAWAIPAANVINLGNGVTAGGGANGTNHQITLATGYQITEGARFGLEGQIDMQLTSAAGDSMGFTYGVAGMFAYSF